MVVVVGMLTVSLTSKVLFAFCFFAFVFNLWQFFVDSMMMMQDSSSSVYFIPWRLGFSLSSHRKEFKFQLKFCFL